MADDEAQEKSAPPAEDRLVNPRTAKRYARLLDELGRRYPGYDPVVAMAEIAQDDTVEMRIRVQCHSEVASYVHSKRKATELTGEDGGPIEIKVAAVSKIMGLFKHMEQTLTDDGVAPELRADALRAVQDLQSARGEKLLTLKTDDK